MNYLNTPTSFISVDGVNVAYRELSAGTSPRPLVMLVHLAANLDNWDPLLVDQLAQSHHLILLDLPGVGASDGEVAPTLEQVVGRLASRKAEYADKAVRVPTFLRQLRAIKRWGVSPTDDLSFITMPTLVVNGDRDDMVPTPNSYEMHQRISGSRLVIYPHAGHGSLFQNPKKFTAEVEDFLAGTAGSK